MFTGLVEEMGVVRERTPSAAGARMVIACDVVREGLAKGVSVSGLALVEAIWARMCEGTREDGSVIEPNDPFWADLNATAKAARVTPLVWLAQRQFYGDLADDPRFAGAFADWLTMIWADGLDATLAAYLKA